MFLIKGCLAPRRGLESLQAGATMQPSTFYIAIQTTCLCVGKCVPVQVHIPVPLLPLSCTSTYVYVYTYSETYAHKQKRVCRL